MSKVIVTGGAGFIGSHIVEYWLNEGAEVHVIDNLRTGKMENVRLFPKAIFHEGSITNRDLVFDVLKNCDYVYNLAALVSVPESLEKPNECININVIGLLNILDAAKDFGCSKVVHSSSAAIYGDDPELPKRISMKPSPKTPYGITKLDGEYYLQMYYEQYGLSTVSLRYFNVFGPRQDPTSQYAAAVPIFIYKAVRNEDIIIFGDGEQTRDFIYVKDVVKANIMASQNKNATGVYNVANGNSITIYELAKQITELTNSSSEIKFAPARTGDIKHSLASIEETISELKFSPDWELKEAITKTIKHFNP